MGRGFGSVLCVLLLEYGACASMNDIQKDRGADIMRREGMPSSHSKNSNNEETSIESVQKLQSAVQEISKLDAEPGDMYLQHSNDEGEDHSPTTTDGAPTPDSDELEELNAEPRGPQGITDPDDPGVDYDVHGPPKDLFSGEREEERESEGESIVQLEEKELQNSSVASTRAALDGLKADVMRLGESGTIDDDAEPIRPRGSVDAGAALDETSDEGVINENDLDVNHADNLVKHVVQSYLNTHKDQLQELIQSRTPGLPNQKMGSGAAPTSVSSSHSRNHRAHGQPTVNDQNAMQLGTVEQRSMLNSMLVKLKKDKGLLEGAENLQDEAVDAQDTEFKKTERDRIAVDTTEDSFLQLKAQMLKELRAQL